MKYEGIPLVQRPEIHNFEMLVDGYRAFMDYEQRGNKLYLLHTEVAPELEGKGVASALIEKCSCTWRQMV